MTVNAITLIYFVRKEILIDNVNDKARDRQTDIR